MIARSWHGRVPSSKADEYFGYLQTTGLADYTATPGNRGVFVFRRTEGAVTHFLLTTLWDSIDAIKRFAGEDHEQARYYPEDDTYLLEREPRVTHHEVLVLASGQGITMSRDEWTTLIREATSHLASDPDTAALQLRALLDRTRAAADQAVEGWHVRQTLCLLAEAEKDRGQLEESARVDMEAASHAEAAALEARQSAAVAFAQAALRHFELRLDERAMQLARRAFELADLHSDPSTVFERLLSEVRLTRQARAAGG